ncbi:hypothetical protein J6590_006326 [Homalodisca vitripennis]|nr:hypothetical protein J6590_006326 [Homalodisca vitripennis]
MKALINPPRPRSRILFLLHKSPGPVSTQTLRRQTKERRNADQFSLQQRQPFDGMLVNGSGEFGPRRALCTNQPKGWRSRHNISQRYPEMF